MVSIMATLAAQERQVLGERTKAGLQRVRARGGKLGRPVLAVDMAQVHSLRDHGYSIRQIAEELGVSASLLAGKLRAEGHAAILERIEGVRANGL